MTKKIIILHGWGQDRSYWQGIIERIAGEYEVVAIDFPGFGDEALVSDDWGIPAYANWLKSRLSNYNSDEVLILGHSFGGRVAAYLVAQKLFVPSKLVLYAAPLIHRLSLKLKLRITLNKILKLFVPTSLRSRLSGNPELAEADQKGLGKIYRNVVNFDQSNWLADISAQTLLLWGENDLDVPLWVAKEANQLIPDSHLEIMPGLGHNAHLENPNLFYGKIKKFIQTNN